MKLRPVPDNCQTALVGAVLAFCAACGRPEVAARDTVEISAVELHRAYREDAAAAGQRFGTKTLLIEGEVGRAEPRFIGTTMQGDVTVEPKVYFVAELDTLAADIKYVVAEGSFEPPGGDDRWSLDPRIRIGSTARVECPGSTLRWTDPGLYLSECRLAME